jgi:hypothetical protein
MNPAGIEIGRLALFSGRTDSLSGYRLDHMSRNDWLDRYALKMLRKREIHISARFGTGGFEGVSRVATTTSIVKTYPKSALIVRALGIHHLTSSGPDQTPSQSSGRSFAYPYVLVKFTFRVPICDLTLRILKIRKNPLANGWWT